MIKRIKEYLEYRKNKKIARREMAKITATILPLVREVFVKVSDIMHLVIKLANTTKDVEGEKLIEMILNETSTMLNTDNSRIIEILTYMVNLSPEDIRKILVSSVVETMPTNNKAE